MTHPRDEGPSPEDIEAFGDATVECPSCGATLFDDVELCYKCGHALGAEAPEKPAPPWRVIVVIALVLVLSGGLVYVLRAL